MFRARACRCAGLPSRDGRRGVSVSGREGGPRRGPLVKAAQKRGGRMVVKPRVAPEQPGERVEAVVLDRLDNLGLHWPELAGRAEGAVAHMTPGAPGDLRDLGGGEAARRLAVELDQLGEGDVIEGHVETHAYGVGRHQVADLPGLEQADPRI